MLGGWDKPDVAQAQLDLVITELEKRDCGPYTAFRWAMDQIGMPFPYATLLDVGCGVGHYGVLCEKYYPAIKYHGTDVSEAMIIQARQLAPLATFSVCEFYSNHFADYDIVLLSQVCEMIDDTPGALDYALDNARKFVILNRIRLTTESVSQRIREATYRGNRGQNWLWNRRELERLIGYGYNVAAYDWDGQVTFLLRRLD